MVTIELVIRREDIIIHRIRCNAAAPIHWQSVVGDEIIIDDKTSLIEFDYIPQVKRRKD